MKRGVSAPMRLRRDSTCEKCGAALPAGSLVRWLGKFLVGLDCCGPAQHALRLDR